MTTIALQRAWTARPFRPFVLHLADGRSLPVRHPEFLWVFPPGRTVVVGQPDGDMSMVDLLLVTELEFRRARSRGEPRN